MPRKIGPHSRPGVLALIDKRRAEARLMSDIRADLTSHLGGVPSATQKLLIERVAALSLRLHLMDREAARSGDMSERNSRQYLAWSNTLSRTLRHLGLTATPPPQAKPLTPRQMAGIDPIPAGTGN